MENTKRRMVTYYRCKECGSKFYYPSPCPNCKSKKFKKYKEKQQRIIVKA